MKPGPFNYCRPASVQEAIALLAGCGGEAKVLAGGQSLVPMLNLRMAPAECLVDITGISSLKIYSADSNEVLLGACITHEQIQVAEAPDPSNGLMPWIASRIAYQAIRNRGTIGGSLALADPAADWLTTTAALGAVIEWEGPDGSERCPSDEFVLSAYTTRLGPSDLLTAIRIPRLHPDARWGTFKLCRKTGEFAHAIATVIRQPNAARAFLGATDGAPIRLRHAEQVLGGLRTWEPSLDKTLSDAMSADLASSGRRLTDVHVWQFRTCLSRAVQMSFGIEEIRVGRLG
jgi:carbon-monoxide dehydrogenase medium subunit